MVEARDAPALSCGEAGCEGQTGEVLGEEGILRGRGHW